jgi:tetratricopeptide (TPR) repeat protein
VLSLLFVSLFLPLYSIGRSDADHGGAPSSTAKCQTLSFVLRAAEEERASLNRLRASEVRGNIGAGPSRRRQVGDAAASLDRSMSSPFPFRFAARSSRYLFVTLLLCASRPAFAEPQSNRAAVAESDAKARARRSFEQGQVHYDLGEYDLAIASFREAYELSLAPALLFNIAQAHRLKGDCAQALEVYRHFLRRDPDSVHRGDAEAQIKSLREQCRPAAGDAVATGTPAAPPAASAETASGPATKRPDGLSSGPPTPMGVPNAIHATSPGRARVVLVVWSSAVVLVGAAVAVHLWNDGRYDQWHDEDRRLYAPPPAGTSPSDWVRRQNDNDDLLQSIKRTDRVELGLALTAGACVLTGAALTMLWQPLSFSNNQVALKGTW